MKIQDFDAVECSDQPTTCGKCGARTRFIEDEPFQLHWCMDCNEVFVVEYEYEEEEMEKVFYVSGSYGTIKADAETGEVIEYFDAGFENEESNYSYITKFNIEEWQKTYPQFKINGRALDILDIGQWDADGNYYEHEEDWRGEARALDAENGR